jgi:hypothetical protein
MRACSRRRLAKCFSEASFHSLKDVRGCVIQEHTVDVIDALETLRLPIEIPSARRPHRDGHVFRSQKEILDRDLAWQFERFARYLTDGTLDEFASGRERRAAEKPAAYVPGPRLDAIR